MKLWQYRLAFVLSLMGVAVLVVLGDRFIYSTTSTYTLTGMPFDTTIPQVRERIDRSTAKRKSLNLDMQIKPTVLGPFSDVVQTAPGNDGVRIEVGADGEAAAVVKSTNPLGYRVLSFGHGVPANVWSRLQLKIDPNNHVQTRLNGVVVDNSIFPDLYYDINDIVVGSGFSKERPFVGEIRDWKVEYTLSAPVPDSAIRSSVLAILKGLLMVASVVFMYLMSDDRARSKQGSGVEPANGGSHAHAIP